MEMEGLIFKNNNYATVDIKMFSDDFLYPDAKSQEKAFCKILNCKITKRTRIDINNSHFLVVSNFKQNDYYNIASNDKSILFEDFIIMKEDPESLRILGLTESEKKMITKKHIKIIPQRCGFGWNNIRTLNVNKFTTGPYYKQYDRVNNKLSKYNEGLSGFILTEEDIEIPKKNRKGEIIGTKVTKCMVKHYINKEDVLNNFINDYKPTFEVINQKGNLKTFDMINNINDIQNYCNKDSDNFNVKIHLKFNSLKRNFIYDIIDMSPSKFLKSKNKNDLYINNIKTVLNKIKS